MWDIETGSHVFEFNQLHGDSAITSMSFDSTERRSVLRTNLLHTLKRPVLWCYLQRTTESLLPEGAEETPDKAWFHVFDTLRATI